ncbi:MAG TPA: transglutaminase-like domain-containing protein [Gemmatimonadaceae bacterium]|nr:transglutaminase-like domain-containing protein [Gemmatimonadaceae bacterium]
MNRRGAVAVGVLIAWAAGLAMFLRRERAEAPARRLAEAAMRVAPGGTYYRVERNGRHVGYASSTVDTAQSGFSIVDYLVADVAAGGSNHRVTAQSDVRLTRRLELAEFALGFEADSAPIDVTGRVLGDSLVAFSISHGAGSQPDSHRVRIEGPILLPTIVPLVLALGEELAVGQQFSLATFDPTVPGTRPMGVRVAAESLFTVSDSAMLDASTGRWVSAHSDTVRAFQLASDGPTSFRGWVDRQGRLVAVEQALGFSLHRTAYEEAFENWRLDATSGATESAGNDLLTETAISAGALDAVRNRQRLTVRLSGLDTSRYELGGGRQHWSGDTLTITREDSSAMAADWTRPATGAFRRRYRSALAAEPLLERDAPEIRALAVRLTSDTRDPAVAARRLLQWVHDSLEKRVTVTVPSARQVLAARAGDCNEHAQLYVALARAAGIPSRVVAGVAWVNGRFYYHAWPEVLLNDWVAVDPTFGQFPASASHIRLVRGGLASQAELVRLMGRMRLDVIGSP